MNKARLRREQEILDRLDEIKRLVQMEYTIETANGAKKYAKYCMTGSDGKKIGGYSDNLLNDLREEIQLQLLSVTALCYGNNPDLGEPCPMLEWKTSNTSEHSEDKFRDMWEECLQWNAYNGMLNENSHIEQA